MNGNESFPENARELAAAYCNDLLDDEQLKRLEQRLIDDPEARAEFRRYLALDAALVEFGEGTTTVWHARSVEGRQRRRRLRNLLLAAVSCAAVVLICFVMLKNDSSAAPVAHLERTVGDVRVLSSGGEVRAIKDGMPIAAGDTVRTRGIESSTAVIYRNGMRLTLVGDTSITCGDRTANSVIVHQGRLAASVEPQSQRPPILIATPAAQLEVFDTKFQIESSGYRTDLKVTEGRVRMSHYGGESIDVDDGKYVSVVDSEQSGVNEAPQTPPNHRFHLPKAASRKIVVQDAPELSNTWEADFEQGLPPGWSRGSWTSDGLPKGSRGAAKAAAGTSEDGLPDDGIKSQMEWMRGLFVVEANSHFHMTFNMERPDWINLLLVTRTNDADAPRFAGNYIFRKLPNPQPNVWYTVSIPLKEFERIHRGDVPLAGLIPYKVSIDAEFDRGLVVDRMWVTPSGPGKVMMIPAD